LDSHRGVFTQETNDYLFVVGFQINLICSADSELRKLVSGVSTCADGTIEFNEFLQMMSKKLKNMGDENELKEAFK
jgi:Ca2+-binding EF-hand superfamily protein